MKPLDPRLLRHVRPARTFVVLTAAAGVATAALVVAQADLLSRVVARAFLDRAPLTALTVLLFGLAAVVAGRALLGWATETAAVRASARVIRQLRADLVDHVLRLGPRDPRLPSTGELGTLATRGVDGLDGYLRRYLPTLLLATTVPLLVGVRLLTADWIAAVIVAVTVPLIPLFMVLVGLRTRDDTERRWRALAVLGHHFLDLVSGLDVLVAFGRAGRQSGRLRALAEEYRRTTLRTLRVAFLSALVLEVLASLSVALVAVSVGLRLAEGRLDLTTGLLVIMLAPEIYLPLRAVGARFHDSAEGLAAADDVFAVLEMPPAATATDARRPAPDPSRVPVRLEHVGVDGRGGPVLDDLDLTVGPGEVLGLRGPSGAGKSTLLDLVTGLRRPDRGRVTVGGVALDDLDLEAWRARIAWVPQGPVLVVGTVADNIRLGAPAASDAAVEQAAQMAQVDLDTDTPVGERGAGLSTGQQRRVALARALVTVRPLMLLDEPTEGVDADTESALLSALPGALAGRSAIVVSHRADVLATADRIVDLPARAAPATESVLGPARAASTSTVIAASATEPAPAVSDAPSRNRGALRWLAAVARPHGGRLALAVLLGAGALGSAVALTATSAWLISAAALQAPLLTLMVAIVAVRAFGLSKGVLRYLERLVSHDAALRLGADLRVRVWQALVRRGPATTARQRRGDLLARLTGDVDAQQDVLVRGLVPAGSALLVATGLVGLFAWLLPEAALALALGLVLAGVVAPVLGVLAGRRAARSTAAARAAVAGGTLELLDGAADLLVLGAAARMRRRLAAADDDLARRLVAQAGGAGVGAGLGVVGIGAAMLGATVVGVLALADGRLAPTALAVLALAPLAAAELVAGLPDAAARLAEAVPAARRLADLEAAPAPVTDPAHPAPVPTEPGVAAESVAVRWPDTTVEAVRDVSFALPPGERFVLAGPSGAGKSTVLAAVARTLPVARGEITLDGHDTATMAADDVRARLGWCGPAAHLFDSTLRENLRLARPNATDDDLLDAVRHARLGDWFASLPDGLDTTLGDHGGPVSGGERQRLAVARVLLADRPVLTLDEPTAHLDATTATGLASEIAEITRGRTAIVVSHRPAEFPDLPVVTIAGKRTVGA
ncbi:glutathione/cysteine ABC transporter permease/ATPase [Actinomycetospora sp. NBRC 106375]|uniref:thiol reductant ABC exporter subunit CydD n=1 Tax=Actinomycetospora sp. NBRC 106375 TaxID=3032207 RepID=UPI0024A52EB2|nr:thiol reductant ABC exporter subunit CydD [Actinomycetospora sp. NBRC 106375]GLZ49854.1 glutathione/cysteine ABC transporter permease/ATPase [Actinomycetospora sp. NBRC 106375]